ncbi:PfkB family carbohydrate kinase [Desulfopila sp. IMCC35008]|uniref:PfkB family carbohydrate kinase n=1 Tax=Desulfopila sp. IMCC35008 TaxID=2653858 RepID=UPI0013D0E2BE|nr:PfkB family carbohydrate kinase [Desulfopila sp. IMCC35008]
MTGKVLFFGLTTVDIFNYVSSFPASNEKVRAIDQLVSAGGPAANGAVSCSVAGNKCTLVSCLGRHPLAQLALEDLQKYGVDVIDCLKDPDKLPVLSTITIDLGSGDRSVIYTNTDLCSIEINSTWNDLLKGVSLIMLDGYFMPQAIEIAMEAKRAKIKVVLDGGSWKVGAEKLLPYVQYAVCSADFYPPGCTDHDEVIQYLHDTGVEYVAISRGSRPIIYSINGQTGTVAVARQEAVDTLGAGDILHGVFCACLVENDFVSSLRRASLIATRSCRSRGTRRWIEDGFK